MQRPDQQGAVARQAPWTSTVILGVAFFAVALRLFFWYYTQRTWEDALITVQHAENAARGLGLTYDPGSPPVHGFTSPLNVLVPLLGEWICTGLGMSLLKFVSAICGGVTVWLAMRISERLGLAFPVTLLIGGYLAIEHQQILFGMAGMETQITVTILLLSIYSLFELRPLLVGTGLGLCMLARPDLGFWVLIVLALFGWHCSKKRDLQPMKTVALMLLLTYGPWIAFTTWYYGSPLPNTVVAKGLGFGSWYTGLSHRAILLFIWNRIRYMAAILGPAYGGNGTGYSFFALDPDGLISCIVLLFVVFGVATALRGKPLPALAIACFVLVYSLYYLFPVAVVALWYCIPLAAVAVLAAGIGLNAALNVYFAGRWRSIAGYIVAATYLASLAITAPQAFRGEKNVQLYVEDGVRKAIGMYLAAVMRPGETIGCEPLGYIGYYSRHVVFAFPGMCNRQVVQFLRDHPQGRNLLDMLDYFHPDYVVLRPNEYELGLRTGRSWLVSDYEKIATFQTSEDGRAQLLFPHDNLDVEFYMLRRTSIVPERH